MKKSDTNQNRSASTLRRRAETQLRKQSADRDTLHITPEEAWRLLHELEMQNEELVQIRAELEAAYRQYTDLYDFAPVGYFTLARDGTVRQVNLAGANLLGVERDKLINRRLGLFVSVESRPAFSAFLKKLLSGKGKENRELAFPKNGNESLWVRIEATCFEGGQECRALMMDISERKQVEEALQKSSAFNQSIIDNSSDCIKTLDLEGRLQTMSLGGQRLVEIQNLDDYLNIPFQDFWKDADHRQAALESISKAQQGLFGSFRGFAPTLGGTPKWWDVSISPILGSDGKPERLLAVSRDSTERKQIEDTLMFLLQSGYSDENFFESLARYLAKNLNMDYVCIDRLMGDRLSAQTLAIYFDGKFEDNIVYTLKDTPCSNVVGETICVFPNQVRHLFPQDVVLQEMRAESYVGTTLWSTQGEPIGLIAVIGRKPLAGRSMAEAVLKLVAVRAAGELERKQAEEELRNQSIHDALTGLYNRGFFEEEMVRLERGRGFPISIIMADVDHLKDINDRLGHAAGDTILKRVAQVLKTAFRTEDVMARIGGDEFAVILPGISSIAAEAALRRVRQVLQEHNTGYPGMPISVSFGANTAIKRTPLFDVLKEADANMYREKRGDNDTQKNHK